MKTKNTIPRNSIWEIVKFPALVFLCFEVGGYISSDVKCMSYSLLNLVVCVNIEGVYK